MLDRRIARFLVCVPLVAGCEAGPRPAAAPEPALQQAPGERKLSLEMALIEGAGEDPLSPGRLQVTLKNGTPDAFTFEEPGPLVPMAGGEPATHVGLVVAGPGGLDGPCAVLTAHSLVGIAERRTVSLAPGGSWSGSYDLNDLYVWGPCGPAVPILETLTQDMLPLEIRAGIATKDGTVVESPPIASPPWIARHVPRAARSSDAPDSSDATDRELGRRRAAALRAIRKAAASKQQEEQGVESLGELLETFCGPPLRRFELEPAEGPRKARAAVIEMGDRAVPFLFEAIRIEDLTGLPECAAELIAELYEAGRVPDRWLLDALKSGDGPYRTGALRALGGGGLGFDGVRRDRRPSPELTAALLELLGYRGSDDLEFVIRALGRPGLVEAVDPLRKVLRLHPFDVMESLARIGPEARSAIPALESIARSTGHEAAAARRTLRRLGTRVSPSESFYDRCEESFFAAMEKGGIRERTERDMDMPPRDADAIIYIVDRSGSSMEGFRFAQSYLVKVIDGLEEEDEIGIIFSDMNVVSWPAEGNLAAATPEARKAAVEFVRTIQGGSGSCPARAFEKALGWAEASSVKRKMIHYIGDGGGTCRGGAEEEYIEEMFEQVTRRSAGIAEIHAIAVGGGPYGNAFLHELASRNRGTFTRIQQE